MDAEVVFNGNSSGRRLPSWMLQKPQPHDLLNNNYNNCSNTESKEGRNDGGKLSKARRPRSKANEKTGKRKVGGGDAEEKEEEEEEEEEEEAAAAAEELREERKKRRKRNDIEIAVSGNDNEIRTRKRRHEAEKRKGGKGNRGWIDSDDQEAIEGFSDVDRDDDLTVEDLMSIAREYVDIDNEGGQRLSSSKDDLTVEELTSIAEEYVKEDTDVRGKYLAEDEQLAERKFQDVAVYKGKDSRCFSDESMASEETKLKPTISEDPTQDMLDLFLGPLLKKPKSEEKNFNIIAQEISLAHAVQKQKQDVAPGEEAVPLTKKKSSLKDKVAMFLD